MFFIEITTFIKFKFVKLFTLYHIFSFASRHGEVDEVRNYQPQSKKGEKSRRLDRGILTTYNEYSKSAVVTVSSQESE